MPAPAPPPAANVAKPWLMMGVTTCRLGEDSSYPYRDTATQPPKVHWFNDDTAGPDQGTVLFRNRFFYWTTAGDWQPVALPATEWKSGAWYRAEVTDNQSPQWWTMVNGGGLDRIGDDYELHVTWLRGFIARVGQEVIWRNPDGTQRDRAYHWTQHRIGPTLFQLREVEWCELA